MKFKMFKILFNAYVYWKGRHSSEGYRGSSTQNFDNNFMVKSWTKDSHIHVGHVNLWSDILDIALWVRLIWSI